MKRISTPDRSDAQSQYRCNVAGPDGKTGTANIYVAYHPGCQPATDPDDTVRAHWTIYGWVAWDIPPVTDLPLPPSDSYGSPASAKVLNAWPISAGVLDDNGRTIPGAESITFASAKAARRYIEAGLPLYCASDRPNIGTPLAMQR
jgi:hypothetical protein